MRVFLQENKEVDFATEKKNVHYVLCSENTKKLWREYHLANAKLQILCRSCHTEKNKRATAVPECTVDITAILAELNVS